MPKNENYIHISGWMVNELKLKGNELLVYALIYGFSQDGESEFKGSLNYMMGWLGCRSKHTVINAVNALVDRGLVEKKQLHIDGVTFNRYVAVGSAKNAPLVQKECEEVVQKMHRGSAKNAPNNIRDNTNLPNTNNIVRPTIEEVRQYCMERGKGVDPEAWYDYYSSNGWKVGKNPMKDWKAAVRTWERNGYSNGKKQTATNNNRFNNFENRQYDFASLEAQLLRSQGM